MAFPFKETLTISYPGTCSGGMWATPSRLYIATSERISGETQLWLRVLDRQNEYARVTSEEFRVGDSQGQFVKALFLYNNIMYVLQEQQQLANGKIIPYTLAGVAGTSVEVLRSVSNPRIGRADPDGMIIAGDFFQVIMDGVRSTDPNIIRFYAVDTGIEDTSKAISAGSVRDMEHAIITETDDIYIGKKSTSTIYGYRLNNNLTWSRVADNDLTVATSQKTAIGYDGFDILVLQRTSLHIYGEERPEPDTPQKIRQLFTPHEFLESFHIVKSGTDGTLTYKAENIKAQLTTVSVNVDVASTIALAQQLNKFRFIPEFTQPNVEQSDWIIPAIDPKPTSLSSVTQKWQIRGFFSVGTNPARQEMFAETSG